MAGAVAGLCLLSLIVKLVVNGPRTGLNHGDVSFYYTVAKNVAEGRGFVIDYIWNFWNDPQGLPTQANVWWMPLTSIVCAIGMFLFGSTYAVAQTSMIVATSVLPLGVFLLAREMFRGRTVPLLAAALAATFHLFMDQPSAPLSHGPYVVLSTFALWLILRAARCGQGWIWAGLAIGATQMARSDGLLLFGALGIAWLLAPPRRWRALGMAALGYVLAMSPWWTHNLVELGVLQPPGSFRAVFMRGYEQWYSLPTSVTYETWLAEGWEPVWRLKRAVCAVNAENLLDGLVSGAAERDKAYEVPALVVLLGLAWLGVLLAAFRRETRRFLAPAGVQLLAIYVFYSLLFTAVGSESFRTGMYSIYPTLLICAAFAATCVGGLLARLAPPERRTRLATGAAALLVAWLVWGNYAWSREALQRKGDAIAQNVRFYETFRDKLLPRLGENPVIMARDVHELHAIVGVRCIEIPLESADTIRVVARRFGVTHILLLGDPANTVRPSLRNIDELPWCKLVAQAKPQGMLLRLYEITD